MKLGVLVGLLAQLTATSTALAFDIPKTFRDSKDSVVLIMTFDEGNRPVKIGSGVVIGDGGLIVSNLHVVQGAAVVRIKSTADDVVEISEVRGFDEVHDLVLLSVPKRGKPLSLSFRTPDVGEDIIAIGNPKGLESTVSQGIVSAVRKDQESVYYQITAPISPGSSGGPILDAQGAVLGIATFQSTEGQNLNFAMPSHYVQELMRTPNPTPLKRLPARLDEPSGVDPVALVKTISDNIAIFDRQYKISVSVEGDASLFTRNLGTLTADVLSDLGLSVTMGADYDYVLVSHPIQNASSVSSKQLLPFDRDVNVYGERFVAVKGDQSDNIDGYSFELLDFKEFFDRGMTGEPPLVWKGFAIGSKDVARNQQGALVRQVLSRLGETSETTIDMKKSVDVVQKPVDPASGQALDLFPDSGVLVNEMRGVWNGGEYAGYVKTRRLRTQRFDGYVQTQGLSAFTPFGQNDEVVTWALGLGALMVVDGVIFTAEYSIGDERRLDSRNLQKLFTLPLTVGQAATVTLFGSNRLHYFIERREAVSTPFKRFQDCFVISSVLEASGKKGAPTRSWVCRGSGIVRQELSTGRVDELTGMQIR